MPKSVFKKPSKRSPLGVPDDGMIKAGAALRYQDNGDGTITDKNTGLVWEKKSDDGTLHDKDCTFTWSGGSGDTIWDWLNKVNTEGRGDSLASATGASRT